MRQDNNDAVDKRKRITAGDLRRHGIRKRADVVKVVLRWLEA